MPGKDRQLTTTSRSVQPSQPRDTTVSRTAAISAILTRLSLHYWRPEFTPVQAALMASDWLVDLEPYTVEQIEDGCATYRRDPAKLFFPHPGAIIANIRRWADPPPRHGVHKPLALTYDAPPATRSVGDILRAAGHTQEAEAWEFRGRTPEGIGPRSTASPARLNED